MSLPIGIITLRRESTTPCSIGSGSILEINSPCTCGIEKKNSLVVWLEKPFVTKVKQTESTKKILSVEGKGPNSFTAAEYFNLEV